LQFNAGAASVRPGCGNPLLPMPVARFRPTSETATRRPVSLTGCG